MFSSRLLVPLPLRWWSCMFERLALPVADPALLAAVLFEPLGKKSD
jgi:hypothetical protein